MAVVAWSPELRIEVKKSKLFGNKGEASQANCSSLSAVEQNAVNRIFSAKTEESKEPKYDYWV